MATIKRIKTTRGVGYKIGFSHPETKKWMTRSVYCSKSDAISIKKKIESDIALGVFSIETMGDLTWDILIKKYYNKTSPDKSDLSLERDRIVYNNFRFFLDEDIKVKRITAELIDRYKLKRLKEVSKQTVSLELRHLKAVFNFARKNDWIKVSPFINVSMPKLGQVKVRFLNTEEVSRLIETIESEGNHRFRDLIYTYVNTGARRTEILVPAFTWDNVDFNNRQIRLNGKRNRWRCIPMNSRVISILTRLKEDGVGVPFSYSPHYVSRKTTYYMKQAGIENASLHSLRKTFGSMLIQKDEHIYKVSKLLGHRSVKTTENYYTDIVMENLRESVDKLVEVF